MSRFEFPVRDELTELALIETAEIMVRSFGITMDEAIGRLNERFSYGGGVTSWTHPFHHDAPEWWAYDIYYGHDSAWWHGTEGHEPVPYAYKPHQG